MRGPTPQTDEEFRDVVRANGSLYDALQLSVFINVPEELYTLMLLRFSLDT